MSTAETAPTLFVEAENGVRYAYRRFGREGSLPIVMNIHFRGNMDHWDPLLVNEIAKSRQVILFDNNGVGRSNGDVPSEFAGWAKGIIAFTQALKLDKIDLLGFSMGGLAGTYFHPSELLDVSLMSIAVIEAALAAPQLVHKLIIAGSRASAPSEGPVSGIVWPQEEGDLKYFTALAAAVTVDEGRKALKWGCNPDTPVASAAADAYWARLEQRTAEPPSLSLLPMDRGGNAQVASILDANVSKPNGSFDRLKELKMPVLVLNGDEDLLVPTSRSWELLKGIGNAQLIIYPRSGHGFLWQYANRVGQDINRFLDGKDFEN